MLSAYPTAGVKQAGFWSGGSIFHAYVIGPIVNAIE